MANEHLIPADEFCTHYNVEFSFINELKNFGLIEITSLEENYFIDEDQLQKLEQYARWHYELDINLEGIEVIDHMLGRIKNMQHEILMLRNKLKIHEQNGGIF